MIRVAIASPFEVWSTGLVAILQNMGCAVVGRWLTMEQMLGAAKLAKAEVLVLAKRQVGDCAQATSFRPLDGLYTGRIVVVLEPADEFSAEEFVALDVEGLILSSASADEVSDCFAGVACGRRWIDPGIRALLGHAHRPVPNFHELSSRELEVARFAASRLSNKKIARELQVSDGTVKMHMHHILAKLGLSSRFDLIYLFNELTSELRNEQNSDVLAKGNDESAAVGIG